MKTITCFVTLWILFLSCATSKTSKLSYTESFADNGRVILSNLPPLTDETWDTWWKKVNKEKQYNPDGVIFTHSDYSPYNITSVTFFSDKFDDRFRIVGKRDVNIYKNFFSSKYDINTMISKSLDVIAEDGIIAVVEQYPNNKYIDQLQSRYKELVASRVDAQNRDKETALAVVKVFGNYIKSVAKQMNDATSGSIGSGNNSTSTTDYDIVSKTNAGTISINRTAIDNMLKVKSHCNSSTHKTWDENAGFSATLSGNDFTKQTASNTVEGNALEVYPSFPAIYIVKYKSTKGNTISATIKFQKPGYYNVEIYPELGK